MASISQIQERIDFYTDLMEKYKVNQKHHHRLKVLQSLLNYWLNQMKLKTKVNGDRN